jgi:hypothetical protein
MHIIQKKTPASEPGPTRPIPVQHATVSREESDFGKVYTQKQETNPKPNVDESARRQGDTSLSQAQRVLSRQGIQRPVADPAASPTAGKLAAKGASGRTTNPHATTDGSARSVASVEKNDSSSPTGESVDSPAARVEAAGGAAGPQTGDGSANSRSDGGSANPKTDR